METLNISPPVLTDKPPKSNDNPGGGNEQPPNEEDEPSITYGKVKVQTSLNVRQGPGPQYARIGSLGPNVRIQILGQEGQWYKIKYGNLQICPQRLCRAGKGSAESNLEAGIRGTKTL